MTGNEALALGALRAGVVVATGYPGTPSTGCLTHLLSLDLPGRYVEWSTNEKVAFEIAAGAAWAGQRALVTMKMSGLNVAYDALISIAYSGTNGGLVVYVGDDPGVNAGMAEQDSRGFARMADLPMLEPANAAEAYALAQTAFELSEAVGMPVFLRLTSATALSHGAIECARPDELAAPPAGRGPLLERDIARYTKAGPAICLRQHAELIERLERAEAWIRERRLNRLTLARSPGGLGIVSCGAVSPYLSEAMARLGLADEDASILRVTSAVPFPRREAEELLAHCGSVLVLEELEPYAERDLLLLSRETGFSGRIVGKRDGTLSRVGEYGLGEVLKGLEAAVERVPAREAPPVRSIADARGIRPAPRPITVCAGAGRSSEPSDLTGEPSSMLRSSAELAAPRPITVCAGCPHRGTYLAIDAAIERAGLDRDLVMVTGDIGCTILGMNPPFDLLWNEVSMGSSLGIAQGYVRAGIETPVVATIGDSTFFHGGMPGLVNAVQHRARLTLVVLDNGWTAMTGMQINPGTDPSEQPAGRRVDLEAVIRGIGPDRLTVVDPYDLDATTEAIAASLRAPNGVGVVIARRECAIQASRRRIRYGRVTVDAAECILCKQCLRVTGCPAISIGDRAIEIDQTLCNGCGLCVSFCPTGALVKEVP